MNSARPRAPRLPAVAIETRPVASSRHARVFLCVWIGLLTGTIAAWFWRTPRPTASDLFQVWAGARALVDGLHPYAAVGPGQLYDWPFPLYYPLTAVIAALPLSALPLRWADPIFVGLSAGALAWALTRTRLDAPQLLLFVSVPYLFCLQTSQWAPLIMASAFVPICMPLLACKPTLGAALLVAYPSRRACVSAGVFVVAITALYPWWPSAWLVGVGDADHIRPYVARWTIGGPLVLLAARRWRSADARLLLAMGLIPVTPAPYEALPLFLIAKTIRESALLSALSVLVILVIRAPWPALDQAGWTTLNAACVFWGLYVPCLILVLRRPPGERRSA